MGEGVHVLQIATGKLFRGFKLQENLLTATLFSNSARLFNALVTKAGTVAWTDSLRDRTPSLVYSVKEAIEGEAGRIGVIRSFGVDAYQHDFSALMTVFLGIVCNPDRALVERLTNGKRGLATRSAPSDLVSRMFDPVVRVTPAEGESFTRFVDQLIGIPREKFRAVMQSIRTLVTGLHRMGDDLEVAYTLIVAAIESLAVSFDGHETTWEDVSEIKRLPIEAALKKGNASAETADALRTAIAGTEHVLMRRRFKEFVLATLPSSFFAEDAVSRVAPMGRLDLADGLDTAYELRSAYVHSLERLPNPLDENTDYRDMVILVDRKTALTFEGLLRVARAVITEFVARQPQLDNEPCAYTLDIPSIVQVRLAPIAWMHHSRVHTDNAKEWFEGFLELLDASVLDGAKPEMADLRPCLDAAASLLGRVDKTNRKTFVALINAAWITMPESFRATASESVFKKWNQALVKVPCPESLMLYCLAMKAPDWPLVKQEAAVQAHLRARGKKSGFRFPRRLDAAIVLELAERCRAAGDWERAAGHLAVASENFPEFAELRSLRAAATSDAPINWREVLLHPAKEGEPS